MLLKIIIQCLHCFTGQPSITLSRRSVLNFKFLVLTFLRSMASQWASGKKWAKWKYSTPIYVQCDSMYRSKFCCQEIWAFPSRLQSLPAATRLVEENLLTILRYWLSSRVKNVLMLCKFWAVTSILHVKLNFRWNWREVVADQSCAHCFAQSFDHTLVSE